MNHAEDGLHLLLFWVSYGAAGLFIIGFVMTAIGMLPIILTAPPKRGRNWLERSYYGSQHTAEFFTSDRYRWNRKLVLAGFSMCFASLLVIWGLYPFRPPGS